MKALPTAYWKPHHKRKRRNTPHVCGEDSKLTTPTLCGLETPPRGWGRRQEHFCRAPSGGNTPTYVGKTHEKWASLHLSWKHPHVCGEDRVEWLGMFVMEEAPPPVWGRLFKICCQLSIIRNTPHMCVENSSAI